MAGPKIHGYCSRLETLMMDLAQSLWEICLAWTLITRYNFVHGIK